MGKDVPCRSRGGSSLPTSPFSNLYFTIRNLAREYGRGARAHGGESALQSWMVGLLEASGLRETVSCITEAGHCRGALGGAPRRVQMHTVDALEKNTKPTLGVNLHISSKS